MNASDDIVPHRTPRVGLLLGVLGVVYGDIGTSPLYAFKASMEHFKDGGMDRWKVLGLLSMIFWSLVLVVTVKYVLLVMRADNRGEGGILSLITLAQRVTTGRMRRAVALVGITGACLFFGDGTITPAISVLSAVEGLEVVSPELKQFVLPSSAIVIVVLFLAQHRGTHTMGRAFGPVMAVWFGTLGLLGIWELIGHPYVLLSINPYYAIDMVARGPWIAFVTLGAVVLCVTGAEALYADMGHFGRQPIRLAWLFYVLPCLVLNYFGQGALVLSDPTAIDNPFFRLGPDWLRLPMVFLATAATIIASQSMISGAHSIARQCVQLGFLPRMTVSHTSATEEGQIYLPQVNYTLLVGVLVLVAVFRNSDSLAAAYGIAVTGTFTCTSVLSMVVYRRQFGWPRLAAMGAFGTFFVIDVSFFTSNLLKVPEGGWVPLVFAVVLISLMTTWKRGRDLLLARWRQDSLPLATFLARLPQSRIVWVPGIAVFLTGNPDYVPNALLHNLKYNKVLHERVLFVTVMNLDVPDVPHAERSAIEQLAPGIFRVVIRYGFMESPNIPRDLVGLRALGIGFDPMQVGYFLGRDVLVPAMVPKMPLWRHRLFLVMARNALSATEFFRIPTDRVVELGVRVAI